MLSRKVQLALYPAKTISSMATKIRTAAMILRFFGGSCSKTAAMIMERINPPPWVAEYRATAEIRVAANCLQKEFINRHTAMMASIQPTFRTETGFSFRGLIKR